MVHMPIGSKTDCVFTVHADTDEARGHRGIPASRSHPCAPPHRRQTSRVSLRPPGTGSALERARAGQGEHAVRLRHPPASTPPRTLPPFCRHPSESAPMQPVLPPPFTHMWPRCASSRPSSKLASLNACGVSCGRQGTGRGQGCGRCSEGGKARAAAGRAVWCAYVCDLARTAIHDDTQAHLRAVSRVFVKKTKNEVFKHSNTRLTFERGVVRRGRTRPGAHGLGRPRPAAGWHRRPRRRRA